MIWLLLHLVWEGLVHDGSSHCAPQAPITIRTLASSAVGLYLHRSPQIYPQFGSTTSQSTNTFSNNVLTRTFRSQNHPVPRVKHTEATCTGLPGGGAHESCVAIPENVAVSSVQVQGLRVQ